MVILALLAKVAHLTSLGFVALGEDVSVFTLISLIWHAPLFDNDSTLLALATPLRKVIIPGVLSVSLMGTRCDQLFQLLILDFQNCFPVQVGQIFCHLRLLEIFSLIEQLNATLDVISSSLSPSVTPQMSCLYFFFFVNNPAISLMVSPLNNIYALVD
jgi:hypothetical protein